MKIKVLLIFTTILLALHSYSQDSETENQFNSQGQPEGLWVKYYEIQKDGQPVKGSVCEKGLYKDGRKHGLWVRYTPEGKESYSVTYNLGMKHGEEKIYYWDGRGAIKEKINWKNDKKDGEYTLYRLDYRYDYKRNWNPEPVIEEVITYKNGAHNGETRRYYPSGKISEIANYKNGQANGEWVGYTEGGQMTYKATYKDGIQISYYKF